MGRSEISCHTQEQLIERGSWEALILGVFLILLSACNLSPVQAEIALAQSPSPTPDRLAEPVLPDNPTQYEQGRHLFWLNCMPCHGDRGQGLTDEFRSLWVDDHQDCWQRGCHGGRANDQGYPLPPTIPAIIYPPGAISSFKTAEDLFECLRTTHAPQRPGKLPEDEYWALTAYVLTENQRLTPGKMVGPQARVISQEMTWGLAATGVVLLIASSIVIRAHWRHKSLVSQ